MTTTTEARSDAVTRLSALASGLCQDAGIEVEVRPGPWMWDAVRRVLTVSAEMLRDHGADVCAGVLASEVGHYYLTRHPLFYVDFPSLDAGRSVLDALDDARVNAWMARRYPGVAPWLARIQEGMTEPQPDLPEFMYFVHECSAEPVRGWAPADYKLPPDVVHALELTRKAREDYATIQPPVDVDTPIDRSIGRLYREYVWPALVYPRFVPGRTEQLVQLRALEAMVLAEEAILPHAEVLYRRDQGRIEQMLMSSPSAVARARRLLEGRVPEDRLREFMRHAAGAPAAGPVPPWLEELARELMEALLRGDAELRPASPFARPLMDSGLAIPMRGLPGFGPSHFPPLRWRWTPPTDYDREYERVAHQIDQLAHHLDEVLRPRRRLGEKSGYPSGRKVDLRKLMKFEADPRLYDELWIRSSIPDRKRVAISLLVDLSGSMSGDKARTAVLGTILMAETLTRIDVPFAVTGFQDKLIPFVHFDERYADRRQVIPEMIQEVDGNRTGGNNQPGYNDDGPCVLAAAEILLDYAASDRILIVVSDGEPAGNHSNAQDLHNVVARLTQPEVPMDLIGLGLGAGTDHVRSYYPTSVASVPVERFADEIGRVIEEIVLGS